MEGSCPVVVRHVDEPEANRPHADLRLGRLRGSTLAFHWFLPGAPYRIARASSSNRGRRRVHRQGGPGNESPFPRALELGFTKKVQSCETVA